MNYSSDYNQGEPSKEEREAAAEKFQEDIDAQVKAWKEKEHRFWEKWKAFVASLLPHIAEYQDILKDMKEQAEMHFKTRGGVQVPPVEGWEPEKGKRVWKPEKSEDPAQKLVRDILERILDHQDEITHPWDRRFIDNVSKWHGNYSPKQRAQIRRIAEEMGLLD